ncbi:MAG: MbnH family di-heme enzyme [Myxococcota bacterium]
MRLQVRPAALLAIVAVVACAPAAPPPEPPPPAAFDWSLPPGFPEPAVPPTNAMSPAKVELGRHLFYDVRLSANRSTACASCHRQELAFTDGRARAIGSTGARHPRSAMSLANVAYNATLTWADPRLLTLEDQIRVPLFNESPVELGVAGNEAKVLARLREVPRYRELFRAAFPDAAEPIVIDGVIRALAAFARTLISGDSAYDRLVYRDERTGLSASALRGMRLFFSERTGCASCHAGFNFSGPVRYRGLREVEPVFHNTGLYNLQGRGLYPAQSPGLVAFTGRVEDTGRFRAPTLRNVELTAPYMHDGSVPTLGEVIDHYAAGGRGAGGPGGARSPYTSSLVAGFRLTAAEREDLVRFLASLTDRSFVSNPRFASPSSDLIHK